VDTTVSNYRRFSMLVEWAASSRRQRGPMRNFRETCFDAAKVFAVMTSAVILMAAMLLVTY
jgi:hypothetical protein